MATVYSLVCWGGKDGKTVTMTIASPCVVSLTNHGLRDGTGVVFSTTGALPTGVTAGTTYYSRSTASGMFNLYDTAAHAIDTGSTAGRVNTSGIQSGTHTAKGAYYLGLSDKSRWTTGGTERIYDGLKSWLSSRKSACHTTDSEVCEVGEAWDDVVLGGDFDVSATSPFNCVSWMVTTLVNGVRSSGFHNGVIGAGYRVYNTSTSYGSIINITCQNATIDGIAFYGTGAGAKLLSIGGYNITLCNCIGKQTQSDGFLFYCSVNSGHIYNNIAYESYNGFYIIDYYYYSVFYNNSAIGCTYGFRAAGASGGGSFFNNIAVGCTYGFSATVPSAGLGYSYFCEYHNNGADNNGNTWFGGNESTKTSITADTATDLITYTAHGLTTGAPVRLFGTTAPGGTTKGMCYYIRVASENTLYLYTTYAYAIAGGATGLINITSTGTAVTCATQGDNLFDLTTDCLTDYANKDYSPVLSPATGGTLVDRGLSVLSGSQRDIVNKYRPDYVSATYPANVWDLGPFEYDHDEGNIPPATVTISITGMASGSEIAIYKASDMSEILAPQSTTGSYTGTYTYTGDTNIIVRVRKGTSATRYLPYEYAGTITSTGFQLVVSQIPDTIAQ